MVILSGWWFGTFFIFPYIGNLIIPIDFHIFQRASNHQPVVVLTNRYKQLIYNIDILRQLEYVGMMEVQRFNQPKR